MGRALLRLKPSRICANRGHYVRYAVPQYAVNALRARLLGGGVAGAAPCMGGSGSPQGWSEGVPPLTF
jgi:hypothetical protein